MKKIDASTDRAILYRDAARLIEERLEIFACHALERVGLSCDELEDFYRADAMAYAEATRPDPLDWARLAWFSNVSSDREEARDARVMALCFMAAMVEAGDA